MPFSCEIYVPVSLEQHCDQHYVILQASRYVIKRWDVEGYFQKGCADEAHSLDQDCLRV